MTKKMPGGSLAYPSNPLAALRELQELNPVAVEPDAPPAEAAGQAPAETPGNAEALPVAHATGSAVRSAPVRKATRLTAPPRRKPPTQKPTSATDSGEPPDPVSQAILEMLARPYTSDLRQGPYRVTTVKIPHEVWERLGWLSSLTGETQQDIITEALQRHFERFGKGR